MSKLRRFAMRRDNVMIRLAIMVMVPVMLIASVSFRAYAQSGYVIYDGEARYVVLSEATEPAEVLSEAGLELGRADIIEMNEDGMRPEITVRRNQLSDNSPQVLKEMLDLLKDAKEQKEQKEAAQPLDQWLEQLKAKKKGNENE